MCCVQETLSTSTPEGQEHALPGARPGGPLFAYLISDHCSEESVAAVLCPAANGLI